MNGEKTLTYTHRLHGDLRSLLLLLRKENNLINTNTVIEDKTFVL